MTPVRAVGVLVTLAGLVLMAAGLLAWGRFGAAGHWPVRTPATSASGVYLGPQTLQRVEGPVTVEVTAPGRVTLAQAPAADVDAFVAGTDVARVRDADGLPTQLEVAPGSGQALDGLGRSDVFSDLRSADGSVRLEVPRDTRRAALVVGDGGALKDAVVTVTYTHRSWSLLAMTTALVGLVLAALGVWTGLSSRHLGRRR